MNISFSRAVCGVFATVIFLQVQAADNESKHGISMVDIPAGEFLMGRCKVSDVEAKELAKENRRREFVGMPLLDGKLDCVGVDPHGLDTETPQRHVTIPAFQMAKTVITIGQYKKFIKDENRTDLVTDDFIRFNRYADNVPVMLTNKTDAEEYIDWLNRVDGEGWRLPSESEWEYACRALSDYKYCGGDDADEVAWHDGNSTYRQEVGQKKPNGFGLYDMSGNINEWVQDCWHDNYVGAPNDGSAWITSCERSWVLRGGASNTREGGIRVTSRIPGMPGARYGAHNGFRVARSR